MDKPVPTDEYQHGEMMGMLTIIMMLEAARDAKVETPVEKFEQLKWFAVADLARFFDKPEEDVILLVQNELRKA
jgi:hypothetical protein